MDERRVFKTRYFARWMRKTDLSDTALCWAVQEMAAGLIDADLGGHVLKKRVGLPHRGKRGALRTLVASRREGRWFFLYGFEKQEQANISHRELDALQAIAHDLLGLMPEALDVAVKRGELEEICHDHPKHVSESDSGGYP